MAEVTAWQSWPLEPMYPMIFFDALRVKIRDDAVVRNKAVCLTLGVLLDGTRDGLGFWIEQTEGAKFWLTVFNDLKKGLCKLTNHSCYGRSAAQIASILQLNVSNWLAMKVNFQVLKSSLSRPTPVGTGP